MIRAGCVAAVLAASLVLAGEIQAQRPGMVEIEITDGGVPLTGIEISQFVNGVKTRKGTTGGDGDTTIRTGVFDFAPGDEVAVWIRRCEDGRVELVLAVEGEDDACIDEEARAGERCGCEKLGAFFWDSGTLRVDVGARTVSFTPGPVTTQPFGGGRISWYMMGKYEHRYFFKWDDVSGDDPSVVQHETTANTNGVSAYVGVQLGDLPLWGMVGGYIAGGLDTDTTLNDGTRVQGEVKNYGLGGGARVLFRREERLQPFVWAAGFHTWNKGDFDIVNGAARSDHRVLKSWTGEYGVGATYWMQDRLGVDFGVSYNGQFKDNNADENVRASVGLVYNGGRICGGQCGGRR